MTSERYDEAYVWIWLPGETAPVVAGLLERDGTNFVFNYGQSYLKRGDAIAIYDPELPLKAGRLPLLPGLAMPGCIRDGSPDAWGRRVLINRKFGLKAEAAGKIELDELTYLLESGSDRVGALDFQRSATVYEPRQRHNATLDELLEAAERVENGTPLPPDLQNALQHGTSLGGARPKALIDAENKKFIAKFSSNSDVMNVVKAEFLAMRLAQHVGLNVAAVHLKRALNKDVLLVERFDRQREAQGWERKALVSALTMLELDEMMARYASYETFSDIIRHRFTAPATTLKELFGRIVFNIICGNTDDHARNHAAFWDGRQLTLTPAYDICPQARVGGEASQAMLIYGTERASQLRLCLRVANRFLMDDKEASQLIDAQIETVKKRWKEVGEEAQLSAAEELLLWGRQFLNPFIFEGWR